MDMALPHEWRPAGAARGFTIVEMLVAMTVLTILAVFISQLAGTTVRVTEAGRQRMNLDGQARTILDRLGADFAKMVKRGDVDYVFTGVAADNDRMAFYCELPGYPAASGGTGTASTAGARTLSAVGYRINADPANLAYQKLERGSVSLDYGQNIHLPNRVPVIDDANYQVISAEVFRFEIAYLLREDATVTPVRPPFLSKTAPTKIADLDAVVVGIALLDITQKAKLGTTSLPRTLITALPDATDSTDPTQSKDFGVLWTPLVLDGNTFAQSAGVSPGVASGVRIYQRYYYLK